MNKLKKIAATGLTAIVSAIMPFATISDLIPVHSETARRETKAETKYFCGGWMYTKDGHKIGLYDGFYPKHKADRIMDFQDKAERLWYTYGDGSQELKDYLSNFPDLTVDL